MKLPEPSPDIIQYRKTLLTGFLLNPTRFFNYLKFKLSKRNSDISYLPLKMDLEPNSRCNFRCKMCAVSGWKDGKRADDMTFSKFKDLLGQQKGVFEIKIQGMGEPLLNKDIFKMIEFARKKHIWVRLTTNASILHINENYKKLVDADPNEIQISIDGTTKNTFEKIRIGSNFEQIKKNCKLINDYCDSKKVLKTRMWTVLQKDNLSEIYIFPRLAKELNFKRWSLSLNLGDWGQEEWSKKNKNQSIENLSPIVFSRLYQLGQDIELDISCWAISSKYSSANVNTICSWPFERAFISSDSRVVPCCMIGNPDVADLGEADDFKSIWSGKPYQVFRKMHLSGNIPNYCKNCYVKNPKGSVN